MRNYHDNRTTHSSTCITPYTQRYRSQMCTRQQSCACGCATTTNSTSISNAPSTPTTPPPQHHHCNKRHRVTPRQSLLLPLLLLLASLLTLSQATTNIRYEPRHPPRGAFIRLSNPVVVLPKSSSASLSYQHQKSLSSLARRQRERGHVKCAADLGMAIYDLQIAAKDLVDTQLTHLTPVSGAVLYGAGLLTSLSPCALSLVPLTMAYLTDDGTDPEKSKQTLLFRASMFTVGLATSLSVLGLSATLAGKLFGSAGAGALGAVLPLTASVVAIAMGLNLLDLISLRLPSFEATLQLEKFPPALQAFLLGATSALIASPCSTPVLASILGFVAASGEPYLGAGLLFAYSLGYSTPLLLAGVVSGTVTSFIAQKGDGFSWVTPATAALLISYGTYSSLNTLFPM